MALTITKISADYSTSPQITPADVAEIARLGFKAIMNNRPDDEGGAGQPSSAAIEAAAIAHGLQYYHIPVVPNNIQADQVAAFSKAWATASKPMLGFCRTGNRAANMLALAQAHA
ncbi:MAG TPA: TIGR01244 family sulfur transferase [Methylophilus sp.]